MTTNPENNKYLAFRDLSNSSGNWTHAVNANQRATFIQNSQQERDKFDHHIKYAHLNNYKNQFESISV